MRIAFFKGNMYKGILLLFALSICNGGNAQTITTIAGNGTPGYNGDGVAATTQFWAPTGVALNGNGNVYVADRRNNRIRMITVQGKVITIAGIDDAGSYGDNEPATDAQLNNPAGLAVDAAGNVYIADKNNNRIRKIAPTGIISAFAGSNEAGYSGDGGPATAGKLNAPTGIAVDRAGNVYIADAGNNCIRKVTSTGYMSTIAGTGVAGYNGDTLNAIAVRLNVPNSVAVDSAGNVYIADTWNYRIRKVTHDSIISTIAGTGAAGFSGDGKAATVAELNLPTGVAVDKNGNVYITDQGNNRVRRITTEGMMSTIAGTGNAGYSGDNGAAFIAELNEPYGIATDAAGNLYVAEQQNNTIRRITAPPAATRMVRNTTNTGNKITNTNASSRPFTPPPFSNGAPAQVRSQSVPISPPMHSSPAPSYHK
jgi:trimeric autotransporter adhesin